MRLGVKVGQGCTTLLDAKMRKTCRADTCSSMNCRDSLTKKQRHVRTGDERQYGDVWFCCAIDADTKLMPSFKVGKRDLPTAKAFVSDAASPDDKLSADFRRCIAGLR